MDALDLVSPTPFFKQAKLYMYGAIIAFVLILLGTLWFQYRQIEKKNQELAVQDIIIKQNTKELENIKEQRKTDQVAITVLSEYNKVLHSEYTEATDKLEEYKARGRVLGAKPKLVEGLANTATESLFKSFECNTGEIRQCSKDSAPH